MSIKDDFLAEWMQTGSVSQDTLTRLAEHLRTRPKVGRPTKTVRDLEALAWHTIATDHEGWTSNDAYDQLARNLHTVERNTRKIVAKARLVNHILATWKTSAQERVALVFLRDIRKIATVSVLFNGQNHTTFQTQKVVFGKDCHFFLFDKSTF